MRPPPFPLPGEWDLRLDPEGPKRQERIELCTVNRLVFPMVYYELIGLYILVQHLVVNMVLHFSLAKGKPGVMYDQYSKGS
jgi:hypothetical protein